MAHDGPGEVVATVALTRGALSVSGGALRGFDDDGVLRGHVIDPRDGVPVPAGRLAWVRHPSAAASDALATALLVDGPDLDGVSDAEGAWMASADEAPRSWPSAP